MSLQRPLRHHSYQKQLQGCNTTSYLYTSTLRIKVIQQINRVVFRYRFLVLQHGFRITRCYIYKVLKMGLLHRGANSSASCEDKSRKGAQKTSLYLKVLSSLPQSSSLHEGCLGQPGPPSVSLQSQGLRHKFPTSTAKSPLRSDHSLHLALAVYVLLS